MEICDLSSIKVGDVLIVEWLDASVSKNVKRRQSIPEMAIRTVQLDLGFYAGLFTESKYRMKHIALVNEVTDDEIRRWTSTPLPLLTRVFNMGRCGELSLNFPEKLARRELKILASIKPRKLFSKMVVKRF